MPDMDAFGMNAFGLSASSRAGDAWQRINDKPSDVTIKRGSTTLSSQTVRVEFGESLHESSGGAGTSSSRLVTVFGIQNHPTEDDTDIRRGDRFAIDGVQYSVVDVVTTLGEIQARCEAMS